MFASDVFIVERPYSMGAYPDNRLTARTKDGYSYVTQVRRTSICRKTKRSNSASFSGRITNLSPGQTSHDSGHRLTDPPVVNRAHEVLLCRNCSHIPTAATINDQRIRRPDRIHRLRKPNLKKREISAQEVFSFSSTILLSSGKSGSRLLAARDICYRRHDAFPRNSYKVAPRAPLLPRISPFGGHWGCVSNDRATLQIPITVLRITMETAKNNKIHICNATKRVIAQGIFAPMVSRRSFLLRNFLLGIMKVVWAYKSVKAQEYSQV